MAETSIEKKMRILGLTREEALELEEADKRISRGENLFPLTKEQEQVSKKARQVSREPTVYKFDTSKRKRAENLDKKGIMETIRESLEGNCSSIEMVNPEREMVFTMGGVKYKIVLSVPRK
jgi:hypothetical protein